MEVINLKANSCRLSDNGNILAPDPFRGQPVYMFDKLFANLSGVEMSDATIRKIHSLMDAEASAIFQVKIPHADRKIIGKPVTIEMSSDGWNRLKILIESD